MSFSARKLVVNRVSVPPLHTKKNLAEREQDLAVFLDDSLPFTIVLSHQELEVEFKRFYVLVERNTPHWTPEHTQECSSTRLHGQP